MKNTYNISLLRITNIEEIMKKSFNAEEINEKYNKRSYMVLDYKFNSYDVVENEEYIFYCALNKMHYVKAILLYDSRELIQKNLIDEISNTKLNPMLMSIYINELIDVCSVKQKEIAEQAKVTAGSISNKRRLSKLPIRLQSFLLKGKLKERHARAILKMRNSDNFEAKAERVAREIIDNNLLVDETEDLINKILGKPVTRREALYIKGYTKESLANPSTNMVINHVDKELQESFSEIKRYFPNLEIELEKGVDKEDFVFLVRLKGINKNG